MNHATIDPALKTWAAALTGIPVACVLWENEPQVQHNGALVTLRWVSEVNAGVDATHWAFAENADPLREMTPTTTGNRVAVLQVDVEVHDQSPGVNAGAVASKARTRVYWPRLLAQLAAVQLAVASVGQVLVTDYELDGHFVSRRTLEMQLNGVASETDADGTTSYIATVGTTGGITDPTGATLPSSIQPGGILP